MFKTLKGRIALLLSTVIALSVIITAFSANAAALRASVGISSGKALPGETVSLDVSVENFSSVTGIQLYINYDTVIAVKNVSSDVLELTDTNCFYNNSTGTLSLVEVGDFNDETNPTYIKSFIKGNSKTKILTIEFEIPSTATIGTNYSVQIASNSLFCDKDEELVAFDISNGKVTASEPYIVGDVDGNGDVDMFDALYLSSYIARTTDAYDHYFE